MNTKQNNKHLHVARCTRGHTEPVGPDPAPRAGPALLPEAERLHASGLGPPGGENKSNLYNVSPSMAKANQCLILQDNTGDFSA